MNYYDDNAPPPGEHDYYSEIYFDCTDEKIVRALYDEETNYYDCYEPDEYDIERMREEQLEIEYQVWEPNQEQVKNMSDEEQYEFWYSSRKELDNKFDNLIESMNGKHTNSEELENNIKINSALLQAEINKIEQQFRKLRNPATHPEHKKFSKPTKTSVSNIADGNDSMRAAMPEKILTPPGHSLLTIGKFLFSKKTFELVFEQIIEDMRFEYYASLDGQEETFKSKWIKVRYTLLFIHVIILKLPITGISKIIISALNSAK